MLLVGPLSRQRSNRERDAQSEQHAFIYGVRDVTDDCMNVEDRRLTTGRFGRVLSGADVPFVRMQTAIRQCETLFLAALIRFALIAEIDWRREANGLIALGAGGISADGRQLRGHGGQRDACRNRSHGESGLESGLEWWGKRGSPSITSIADESRHRREKWLGEITRPESSCPLPRA